MNITFIYLASLVGLMSKVIASFIYYLKYFLFMQLLSHKVFLGNFQLSYFKTIIYIF